MRIDYFYNGDWLQTVYINTTAARAKAFAYNHIRRLAAKYEISEYEIMYEIR